jgi:hypothetical protein
VISHVIRGGTKVMWQLLQNFIDQMPSQGATMEIMPNATDWSTLDYDPLQQWIKSGIEKENAK